MKVIAHIYNGFETSFGVPRQGGIANGILSEIVFEKEFRVREAFRGLEDFSHIWVLWEFSDSKCDKFSPTVRPPRLGGNKRIGVFATRSPYRPNPIGLSALELEKIVYDDVRGPVLVVKGADMKNGTPIYDIKPYIKEFDSIEASKSGFVCDTYSHSVDVTVPDDIEENFDKDILLQIKSILAHDVRPSYQKDGKEYGLVFSGYEIKFVYDSDKIAVISIEKAQNSKNQH